MKNISSWNIFLSILDSILKYRHKYKQRVRKCPDSDRLIDFMTRDLIDLYKVDTENKIKKVSEL